MTGMVQCRVWLADNARNSCCLPLTSHRQLLLQRSRIDREGYKRLNLASLPSSEYMYQHITYKLIRGLKKLLLLQDCHVIMSNFQYNSCEIEKPGYS